MSPKYLMVAAATLSLSLPAFAQTEVGRAAPAGAQMASHITDGGEFVQRAGASDLFEIASSELALEMSEDQAIRDFAQQMITDHTASSQRLAELATAADLADQIPNGVNANDSQRLETLRGVSGSEFDEAYRKLQIEAHDTAIALFTSYAEGGDDEGLKQFAAETLPTLQHHRDMLPEGPGELQTDETTGGVETQPKS